MMMAGGGGDRAATYYEATCVDRLGLGGFRPLDPPSQQLSKKSGETKNRTPSYGRQYKIQK
jgi:hypothetical protein